MPDTTNPWAIDFNQFKAATDPYLKDRNFWSDENGSLDSGPQLQLANGKTWRPSGWQSGIVYHPKGEVTYDTAYDSQVGDVTNTPKTNEEEYWEVRGDLSAMTGQPGSEKHVGIKYKKEGDKLVPIEDPLFRDYTTKYGAANRAFLTVLTAGMAANAGLLGNLGGAATTAGESFIPAAEGFKAFEFGNMAATNAAFDASVASGAVTIPTAIESLAPTLETVASTAAPAAEAATTAANSAQAAFRTAELADAASGLGSAAGGALTSTTEGFYNVVTNGIRNATSYISDALGIKNTGLAKDIGSILGVGAAGNTLFDYLMKGLQGGLNAKAASDLLDQKDQLVQDAQKRYSASVTGLKSGLINSGAQPLKRLDGSNVFSGNGLINRSAA